VGGRELPPVLARWLGEAPEVEATHTFELGLLGATDAAIFAAAREASAVVVTKDADFVELVDRRGAPPQVVWVTTGNVTNAALRALVRRRGREPSRCCALVSRWWSSAIAAGEPGTSDRPMPIFDDDEVRSAALARVRQLHERYGGRIPRASLMEGILLRGERIPIWNYQKGIFKPAALGRDGAALSVQTSVDSPYDDEHDLEQVASRTSTAGPIHGTRTTSPSGAPASCTSR
jgi:predicted nuclease of predicted toxin-antitoxin system